MVLLSPGSSVGILVDGHMIYLSMPRGGLTTHLQVDWAFSPPISGVMLDSREHPEAASTFELGEACINHTMLPHCSYQDRKASLVEPETHRKSAGRRAHRSASRR